MANFASDSFTGTNGTALSSHTAEVGGTWTLRTGTFEIQGNKCSGSGAALATLDSLSTGTPDYDVSVDLTITDGTAIGVTGRHHATDNQFYYFRYLTDGYTGTDGIWQLYLFDGGATLLNDFFETQTRGAVRRIKLELRGTTIKGYVDGVEKVTATDSTITASGVAGLRNGGSPGTATLDNFSVDTPGGLTGTTAATSGATGTLTAVGPLIASSTATSGAAATLTATGKLLSTSAATSGATATLSSLAGLFGNSVSSSAATAVLNGLGKLISTSTATSGITGSLTDASAPDMVARANRKFTASPQDLPIRVATSAGQTRTFAAGSP